MIATETDVRALDAPAEPGVYGLLRVLLAISAFAVAADVVIATRLGSRGTGSLLVSAVLGAPVVAAAGWRLVTSMRVRPSPWSLRLLAAFVAWGAASILWAVEQDPVVTRALTNAQLLAFVWLLWQVARSEADLRALLVGFLVGCLVVCGLAWQAYLAGVPVGYQRYAAEGFDPNDMSVTLAIGIPVALYVASGRRGLSRWVALGYLPAGLSAIALSGSRTGAVCAGLAFAGAAVGLARRSRVALVLALALVLGGLALVQEVVPRATWSRSMTFEDELVAGGAAGRIEIWRAGLEALARHPVIGVGASGFSKAVVPFTQGRFVAHNTLLSVAVELGAVGLVLFLAAFASALREAWGGTRSGRAFTWSVMAVLIVGASALTWETRKVAWFVLLASALVGAVDRSPERGGS